MVTLGCSGLISDDEICVVDNDNNTTYVTNISTEHTKKVIEEMVKLFITSCAPIDSNVIVCGKGDGTVRGTARVTVWMDASLSMTDNGR